LKDLILYQVFNPFFTRKAHMVKDLSVTMGSNFAEPKKVHWFHSFSGYNLAMPGPIRNPRIDYGNLDTNIDSLADNDWSEIYPVSVILMSDDNKLVAISEREQQWAELKNLASLDGTGRTTLKLRIFEEMYVEKNGKVAVPQFQAIAAYRRGRSLLDAQVKRLYPKDGDKDEVQLLTRGIPIVVRTFPTRAALIKEVALENIMQRTSKAFNDAERLAIADDLFSIAKNQNEFRKTFGIDGQRLHEVCRLMRKYPDLDIVKRVSLADTDTRYVRYISLSKDSIRALLESPDLTQEKAETYLVEATRKGMQKPKPIMSRADIEDTLGRQYDESCKITCDAILKNNKELLMPVVEVGKTVSLVHKCRLAGKLAEAHAALEVVLNGNVVEQPVVEQPVVEQPVVEQPVVEQPVVEQPVVEQPVVEQPVVEQPVVVTRNRRK
jgi:hypothetical protein